MTARAPDDESSPALDGDSGEAIRRVVSSDGATPIPAGDDERRPHPERPTDREAADRDTVAGDADPDGDEVRDVGPRVRATVREVETSAAFRAIRARTAFDDLTVVRPHDGGRYADAVRARARTNGDERGVSLALLDRPAVRSRSSRTPARPCRTGRGPTTPTAS